MPYSPYGLGMYGHDVSAGDATVIDNRRMHHEDPNPAMIRSRDDFTAALRRVQHRSGMSVRELAAASGIPASTLGGYLSGAHLPARRPAGLLGNLLRAGGIHQPDRIEGWEQALARVRHGSPAEPLHEGISEVAAVLGSVRPPFGRLADRPAVRGRDGLIGLLVEGLMDTDGREARPPDGPRAARVHALTGMGGVGKSTVALEVAHRARQLGVRTWWVNAGASQTVVAGMTAVAIDLGVPAELLRIGSLPDLTLRALDELAEPWLLVLDDADDPVGVLAMPGSDVADGTGWLRPVDSRYGTVIVTTRDGSDQTWSAGGSVNGSRWLRRHRLARLDSTAGAMVLADVAGERIGPADAARALSDRLDGLPLALVLAGRLMAEARLTPAAIPGPRLPSTCAEYVTMLDRSGNELLHRADTADLRAPEAPARSSLTRTWDLSLDLLASRGLPLARPLLRLLSCFGAAPIDVGLVLDLSSLPRPAVLENLGGPELWRLLRSLADVGLVELSHERDPGDQLDLPIAGSDLQVVVHRTVRDAARADPDVRRRALDYHGAVAAMLLRAATGADPRSPSSWQRWLAIAPHCDPLVDVVREQGADHAGLAESALGLAASCAAFRRSVGWLALSKAACAYALRTGTAMLGPRSPIVLELRHQHARARYANGELDAAQVELRAVLETRAGMLGTLHPDTLTTRHYLARTLRDLGFVDEAEDLFARTAQDRASTLGAHHRDTLTSRNNLADVLRERGKYQEAEVILTDVLTARAALLGADHPATLVTEYHLARLERGQGDLPAARVRLRRLHQTSRRVLGPSHPRTLAVEQSIVELLRELGHHEEARRRGRALLDARTEVLGADHPATRQTRQVLTLVMADLARSR
ncbi:tetratricopeptide repeat protein [Pseudofrankia inefficax]|uniref:Helix-turn-helix Psq domain protein n=1 Tax=Pseudofrankia inefficax (strain DSM 45817 / CECT 9037 / DDB 130130 / EuI1c) TaxID=298654 RepID=E3J546_PSEI1|nr:tetratricopeptide repeat protein [Pseudofrankia inefficax]ADP79497.1 helix-turn-helix Psq domain protein [Pseudofrankia inefficax]